MVWAGYREIKSFVVVVSVWIVSASNLLIVGVVVVALVERRSHTGRAVGVAAAGGCGLSLVESSVGILACGEGRDGADCEEHSGREE